MSGGNDSDNEEDYSAIREELLRHPNLPRFTLSRRTVESLMAEISRLRLKIWAHGDKCSSECTPACDEMHTYGPGCWFDRTITWTAPEPIAPDEVLPGIKREPFGGP